MTHVLSHFGNYNDRRYSKPWVATVKNGNYDFTGNVGYYTGNHYSYPNEGDIIITDPQQGIIYACGQKDYRKARGSVIEYYIWDGEQFVACDKAGRVIDN